MTLLEQYPVCPACGESVDLTSSVTNENGTALHEECYVKIVAAKPYEKGNAFPSKFPEREKFKSI